MYGKIKEIVGKVKLTIWVGMLVFLAGMVIMGAYGLYPLFNQEVGEFTTLFGIKLSIALMGIGAAIILIRMCFERYTEWKRMKEEISEEDLRP
ncbi:MAG: hypothetical protein U9N61_05990 [Euryarchaeota archaeon]|nr:hypothetical protein [Euryarchaeota archaeon]